MRRVRLIWELLISLVLASELIQLLRHRLAIGQAHYLSPFLCNQLPKLVDLCLIRKDNEMLLKLEA